MRVANLYREWHARRTLRLHALLPSHKRLSIGAKYTTVAAAVSHGVEEGRRA